MKGLVIKTSHDIFIPFSRNHSTIHLALHPCHHLSVSYTLLPPRLPPLCLPLTVSHHHTYLLLPTPLSCCFSPPPSIPHLSPSLAHLSLSHALPPFSCLPLRQEQENRNTLAITRLVMASCITGEVHSHWHRFSSFNLGSTLCNTKIQE